MPIQYIKKLYLCAVFCSMSTVALGVSIDDVEKKVASAQSESSSVQQEIDTLYKEGADLDRQYRMLLSEHDRLSSRNNEIERTTGTQQTSVKSLQRQLISIEQIDSQISPLISNMYASLKSFVAADVPVFKAQRASALNQLAIDFENDALPIAVKYQKLLQAYSQEAEYGQKIHLYQADIDDNGLTKQVNLIALGRAVFYYQTLDAQLGFRWLLKQKRWSELSDKDNDALSELISMHNGAKVLNLISLNIGKLPSEVIMPLKEQSNTVAKESVNP